MSVICQCPSCKSKYQLGDQYAGRKIKCPKCSAVVEVPGTAPPAAAAAGKSKSAQQPVTRRKKKRTAAGWVIGAAVGGVGLVAVIAVAAFIKFSSAGGSHAVDPNVPMLAFTFKWPASERSQATLTVNGRRQELPAGGDDFKIELPKVSEPYHFVLQRKGFKPKEFARPLTEDDEYLVAQWEPDAVKGVAKWEQDFAAAKKSAADGHKNVLIVFDASDSDDPKARFRSARFNESVAASPEFAERAGKDYVCVYLDNPLHDAAKAKVRDLQQNKKVTGDFKITVFPTVVVTDPRGRPFGVMEDYKIGGVTAFVDLMDRWEIDGRTLFDLLDRCKGNSDPALIGRTLDFLELNKLDRFYAATVRTLSQKLPGGGQREVTEQQANMWMARFARAIRNQDNAKKEVEDFDLWKARHSFHKHPDVGATLHVVAAMLLAQIGEKDAAKNKCAEAIAFHSKSSYVRYMLALTQRALTGKPGEEVPLPHGSGSGFCIAEDNYIMTNHHVIADAKQIMVHLNGDEERYPAHLVIDNPEGDMAVLKIDLPQGKTLTPIPFAAKDAKIGDEVCAFGWPALLSENSWATLTNGLVSGMDDREGFLVTNCKIEHGCSGGPLCSVGGCCIAGMITAKTATVGELDVHESYGLAIPASKLKEFLKENKEKLPPDFFSKVPKVSRTNGAKLSEVVDRVQPSAVYVENNQ